MKVGDLVKVISEDLRVHTGSTALVTDIRTHTDSSGSVFHIYARMVEPDAPTYWFRAQHVEVISESR